MFFSFVYGRDHRCLCRAVLLCWLLGTYFGLGAFGCFLGTIIGAYITAVIVASAASSSVMRSMPATSITLPIAR